MGGFGSGGTRNGAGRQCIDGVPRVKVSLSLPARLIRQLRDDADRQRISLSQLITDLITKS
jgi:hypothetical protein